MRSMAGNRRIFQCLILVLGLVLPSLAAAAEPGPRISGISIQGEDLFLATPFASPFVLERGNADGEWTQLGLFTGAAEGDSEWFRAVPAEDESAIMDDAIVFTPGDLADDSGSGLADMDAPWTLIRRGAGDEAVYGPQLCPEDPAGASMCNDDAPTVPAMGPIVYWTSTAGTTARWVLDSNGVRTASASIWTSAVPASWIYAGMGDISGDGRPELFWFPTDAVAQCWFLDVNYQFAYTVPMSVNPLPEYWKLSAVGDATGDGRANLFIEIIQTNNTILTLCPDPDGSPGHGSETYTNPVPLDWRLRCAGDVSGDGRVELFFHNTNTGATAVWALDTNGLRTASRTVCSTLVPRGWTLRGCGDVSGDGRVELFWQNANGSTATWFLDTNGVRTVSRAMCALPVPSTWTLRAAVDVNADGRVEILWQSSAGATATWFLNTNGQRTLSRSMCASAVPANWTMRGASSEPLIAGMAIEPPGGDELPATSGAGALAFWTSTAGATARWQLDTNGVRASSASINPTAVPASWIYGGMGDINGDSRPEMFWFPTNAPPLTWFLDASYQYASSNILSLGAVPATYVLSAVGDASGDGYADLFFENTVTGWRETWFLNTAGVLSSSSQTYPSPIPLDWRLRCAGDVNGDGRVELFYHNTNTGATATWFLNTDGERTGAVTTCSTLVPRGWTLRGCGDVSGDGRVELFWQSSSGATATWFLNASGVRTVSRAMCASAVPSAWTLRGAVDVNGDNRVEILWQNTAGASATWFLDTNGVRTVSRTMYATAVPATYTLRGGWAGQVSLGSWTAVAGLPRATGDAGMGELDGALYFVGGFHDSYDQTCTNVYRFDGTSWSEVKGLPRPHRGHSASVFNGFLYSIAGGSGGGNVNYVYRFDGTTWVEVAGLPAARMWPASAVLNGALYSIGGASGTSQTNVYRYDGTSWAEVAGLPSGRDQIDAVTLDGSIYVVGGRDSSGTMVTNVFRFNGTNWTQVAGLPQERCSLAVTVLNGSVYAAGGLNNSYSTKNNVYKFNGTNWMEVASLPTPLYHASPGILNGVMYVIGGCSGDGITNVYRYNP